MNTMLWIVLLLMIVVVAGSSIWAYSIEKAKLEQLQQYWDVEIGMREKEMLLIMGDGYNRSLLKNNRVKYEWRINAKSYGSSYKGISMRSYSGVKKVTIYTRDGIRYNKLRKLKKT